jgi:hypothetical protein
MRQREDSLRPIKVIGGVILHAEAVGELSSGPDGFRRAEGNAEVIIEIGFDDDELVEQR